MSNVQLKLITGAVNSWLH